MTLFFPASRLGRQKRKIAKVNNKNKERKMKTLKKLLPAVTISVLAFGLFGCNAKITTSTNTEAAAKPANTTTNTASNTATAKKTDKSKPALASEKKPEGESKKAKDNPVPENWVYVYDENKGYGFSVPEGTTGGSETVDGVDTFVASTPAPSELGIVVISFKDKEMSKDDLLDVAVKFLEEMGETVQAGKLTAESEDYAVAEATTTDKDGKKGKAKILVGTDVSDNYVMIVGGDEAAYTANVKTIDEIWGSFEMWSGGASGTN
jgi:hypothetical protein